MLSRPINHARAATLPDNSGHVALALFVKHGTKSEASERAIAQISRAVYDYFLFAPANLQVKPELLLLFGVYTERAAIPLLRS